MSSLVGLYLAFTAFGVGVTVIDMIGVLDHVGGDQAGGGDDASATDNAGSEGGDGDGAELATDSLADGDADGAPGGAEDTDSSSGSSTDDTISGHDQSHEPAPGPATHHAPPGHTTHGSTVIAADSRIRVVASLLSALRTSVYFSLGAGPTGLFAIVTGVGGVASLAWAGGAGVFIAVLARVIRLLVRKDLDSSISSSEFLMEKAVVTVPVQRGQMGKVEVIRYGRATQLYARAARSGEEFRKGEQVRIVDIDDDSCRVARD